MKVRMSTQTTFVISSVPKKGVCWEAKTYLEKNLKNYSYKKIDYNDAGTGFKITFGRYFKPDQFLVMQDTIKRIIKLAIEYSMRGQAKSKKKEEDFVATFEFRDIGKKPGCSLEAAAWADVNELQKNAKSEINRMSKRGYKPYFDTLVEDKYIALFDFPAYYNVLDAAKAATNGDPADPDDVAKVLGHQDTDVRERFENLYNFLEEAGVSV
jgi:hypothetical protein